MPCEPSNVLPCNDPVSFGSWRQERAVRLMMGGLAAAARPAPRAEPGSSGQLGADHGAELNEEVGTTL
jgi:hypothetical protein